MHRDTSFTRSLEWTRSRSEIHRPWCFQLANADLSIFNTSSSTHRDAEIQKAKILITTFRFDVRVASAFCQTVWVSKDSLLEYSLLPFWRSSYCLTFFFSVQLLDAIFSPSFVHACGSGFHFVFLLEPTGAPRDPQNPFPALLLLLLTRPPISC